MDPCFVLLGLILVLWLIWRKQHLSTFKRLGIPGPEPNLLFGNIVELYRKGPFQCHDEWVNKHGRVLGYFYGMKPVLLVADPQILKNVFIKDFTKFCNRERINPIEDYNPHDKMGQAVGVLPGKHWKKIRSVLTPSFTASKMKQMLNIMNSSIETMVSIIMGDVENGQLFDVTEKYGRMMLDTITRTSFGMRTDVQGEDKTHLYAVQELLFHSSYRDPFLFIGLCFPWLKWFCIKAQQMCIVMRNGFSFPRVGVCENLKAVIQYRRRNPQEKRCDILQFMIDSRSPAAENVDVNLLEVGNNKYEEEISRKSNTQEKVSERFTGMSDIEIMATATRSILSVGYGSTTYTLSCVTFLIAKHQDVQQKMYEEIAMFIPNEQNIDYDMISKLKYMDKVIDETLRMYPTVSFYSSRFAMENVEYNGLKIPKGMLVQAATYFLHHDPEFWEEPERFIPERFDDRMNTDGIVYLPFGVGPRNCLGMRFAKLQMKLALAHVLRKFKIALDDNQEDVELEIISRGVLLKNGYKVKMEPRYREDE